MSLKDKNVVVTGGSRGLGLGLVEALVAHGARVTVVARDADALASVRARLGVATISADVTDETAAHRILAEVRPDILVLNAGAKPRMGRLDQLSWADFTATWETDVKAGLYWLQAALNLPLKPGSRVLVGSSGAARTDRRSRAAMPAPSACSGSWPSTPTASRSRRASASASRRSCRCRSSAAPGSATRAPTPTRAPWASSPKCSWPASARRCRPGEFGEKVVSVLDDPQYATGVAFGLKGDTGITVLEGEAA